MTTKVQQLYYYEIIQNDMLDSRSIHCNNVKFKLKYQSKKWVNNCCSK